MAVAIDEVMRALDKLAPFSDAYEWDNSGLLLRAGDTAEGILVALDVTDDVIKEALEKGCSLIVSHHPIMFNGIKRLNNRSPEGRRILSMAANGISLISAHTNADRHLLNDYIARKLGLRDVRPIAEKTDPYKKVVVFVPKGYEDAVMDAASGAGAGHTGAYSCCTFGAKGTGTFMPEEGTHPFIGKTGVLARVEETRLECICPPALLREVLAAVHAAHPYEEPAIDVYDLHAPVAEKGTARIGRLPGDYRREEFIRLVKETFGFDAVRVSQNSPAKIRTVAVCSGGGGSLIASAAANGADAFLTGELKHSDYINTDTEKMLLIEAGHFDTEACFVDIVFEGLQRQANALQWNVNILKVALKRPFIIV
jgi:dinuclear metal center YbgI/SA1388 family protein